MVEGRGRPCAFAMAGSAIGGEVERLVVGVDRSVEILLVAADAGVGCVGVAALVAGGAVVGDLGVGALQGIVGVVVRHLGRIPVGRRGVAGIALLRKPQGLVIGIGRLLEGGEVAGVAVHGGPLEAGTVAIDAGYAGMGSGQRELGGVVVEDQLVAVGMAGQAGLTLVDVALHALVVLVRAGVGVAGEAGELPVVVGVGVAVGAGVPLALVLAAVDGEVKPVVVLEVGRHPAGVGGVAGPAIGAEGELHVVGLGGALEIVLVAGDAVAGRVRVVAVEVALGAVLDLVSLGQGEEAVVEAAGTPSEATGVMAFGAVLRVPRSLVVGVLGGPEILRVAVEAVVAQPVEAQLGFALVAVEAVCRGVGAQQGETVVLVQLGDIVHQPVGGIVAAGAVLPRGLLMHVGVAGYAFRIGLVEHQGLVAGLAVHGFVAPFQTEEGLPMVEDHVLAHALPPVGHVAIPAVDLHGGTVRRLSERRGHSEKEDRYL